MQSELQNLWRPAAIFGFLAWIMLLGLSAQQDVKHLRETPHTTESSTHTSSDVPKLSKLDFSSIADMFLMGTPKQTSQLIEINLAQLPETRLNLSLRGVFASRGSELSGAVIETGDKQPSFFQIGDLISDHITLAAIEGQTEISEHAAILGLGMRLTLVTYISTIYKWSKTVWIQLSEKRSSLVILI